MTERAPARRRSPKTAATASVHFRMPAQLRSRLRRFAEDRNLGESEALRLALSERLNQIDDERELAAAERWQFEQAYATWQEHLRKGRPEADTVGWDAIERIFDNALAPKRTRKRARK